MAKKFEAPRGMEDILPAESVKWQWLEKKVHAFFETWGFSEIRTPILESTELFTRSIGETTDIVHKEMYTMEDRGGRSLTMRPEMTASVGRAVVEHSLLRNTERLLLYYMGAMFRAERPQAGRKRQFHQIGAEVIGQKEVSPVASDFLSISSLYHFLKFLNIENVNLKINDLSLINGENSEAIREKLRAYFEAHKSELDKDSLFRLDKNVLRIFDSKIAETKALVAKTPWDKIAPLSDDFKALIEQLEKHQVPYQIDRNLVRGLDYYTGVVFEAVSASLGAQDAVAGGGRYDRLYHELGGASVPCTGFSIGMERLLIALGKDEKVLSDAIQDKMVYIAPLEKKCGMERYCHEIGYALREKGFWIELNTSETSASKHLKKANKVGARYVIIIGSEEYKMKEYVLKDMVGKTQGNYTKKELMTHLCTTGVV